MQEEEDGESVQEAVSTSHTPLLGPAAFKDPVDQQEHPNDVGEAHSGDHASAQEGEQHQIYCSMNLGSEQILILV